MWVLDIERFMRDGCLVGKALEVNKFAFEKLSRVLKNGREKGSIALGNCLQI